MLTHCEIGGSGFHCTNCCNTSLGLPLRLEAPVMTPNAVIFLFFLSAGQGPAVRAVAGRDGRADAAAEGGEGGAAREESAAGGPAKGAAAAAA